MVGAGLPAEFGNARTTGVGVVDEDGGAVGVDMVGGGDAADVPAVADREQWQHRDRSVLSCVQRAAGIAPGVDDHVDHVVVDDVPKGPGDEALLGKVECLVGEDLAAETIAKLVAEHLGGDVDLADVERGASDSALVGNPQDPNVLVGPGLGVGRVVALDDTSALVVQVELDNLITLTAVQIDRALVHGRVGPSLIDGADEALGVMIDDRDLAR